MHFNKTTGLAFLLFLAVITNVCASSSRATVQKKLILNTVSSTPYNPITAVPKNSYKQPIELNPAAPKSWQANDGFSLYGNTTVSSWQRAISCIVGTAQLAVAVPGVVVFPAVVVLTGIVCDKNRAEGLPMLGISTLACLLEVRLLYAGIANAHNTFAADNDQYMIRVDGRLALGAAELGLAGLCALFANVWPETGEIFYPGCLAFGLLGISDVCLAAHDKHRGLTIARF